MALRGIPLLGIYLIPIVWVVRIGTGWTWLSLTTLLFKVFWFCWAGTWTGIAWLFIIWSLEYKAGDDSILICWFSFTCFSWVFWTVSGICLLPSSVFTVFSRILL